MLSYSVMTMVDTLLVGHLGPAPLAGVGLGGTTSFALLCFSIGLLRGAKTLVSQAVGAGRRDLLGAYRATALWTALGAGLLTALVGQFVALFIHRVAAAPEAGAAAALYLSMLNLAAPVVLVGAALRECRYGEGDARSPMIAAVVANLVNVGLACLFVFAWKCGVLGAATATVIANAVDVALLMVLATRKSAPAEGATLNHMRALWNIGFPTAIQFLLEVGAFLLLAAIISLLSEVEMAAHQIALRVCQFSFLPALAVAEAASVLAGQAVGARRRALVTRVGRLGLVAAVAYTGICSLTFVAGARLIATGFTSDRAVVSVTVRLLYVAAVFQAFDGANIIARGLLRGVGDVRFAAVVGVVTTWVMTPPLAWLLGWRAHLGAYGGWLGLCGETMLGAVILWRRIGRGSWHAAADEARATVESLAA
jgi:MATE family multidrug resistance protein